MQPHRRPRSEAAESSPSSLPRQSASNQGGSDRQQNNNNIDDNDKYNQNEDAAEPERVFASGSNPRNTSPRKHQQNDEGDDGESCSSSSTSSRLQSSFTDEQLIAALRQIVSNNDSRDRSEQIVSIILTSKIQLIRDNCTNQVLLQAVGEFFMWMMPYTESLPSAERESKKQERERGQKICSTKHFEDLFVRDLLRSATSSRAICNLCVSVSRITSTTGNTYFVTPAARDELLKLVKIAPCVDSLHCVLQAICILAYTKKDGVPFEPNPFVCDEVSTIAYKLFCESTVPEIVQIASNILTVQVWKSTPQFCATDADFAQKMLRKLDEATETETISSFVELIVGILSRKQGNRQLFASDEAARVFFSKLALSENPQVLLRICLCIGNAASTLEIISDYFASPDMCRAIFKSLSKQTDEFAKKIIFRCINDLAHKLPRARSTFAQECPDLTQAIIGTLTTATDDETRFAVASVVANISIDVESAKLLFNHVALYDALIHAASRAHDEKTKEEIIIAMRNTTIQCTDFLPLCAARYPFYDERQIELLNIDSLDSLVWAVENIAWGLATRKEDFLELQSILILLEKCGQFLDVLDERIEEGDPKIEETLLTVADGFDGMFDKYPSFFLGDPFIDVTLSLFERSSGAARAVFVNVISLIMSENTLFTIHASAMLRLLQKLDKELRDREAGSLKMDFDIYEILETAARENPELFRDNNFLVDNSALIRSCFERSFEIHENDANAEDKSMLASYLEALYEVDPRMKEKMEGWNGSV